MVRRCTCHGAEQHQAGANCQNALDLAANCDIVYTLGVDFTVKLQAR
jgi:hypothetical protein